MVTARKLYNHIYFSHIYSLCSVWTGCTAMAKDKQRLPGQICCVKREVLWFMQIQNRVPLHPWVRIFTHRSLNIYGCKAQLHWSQLVCTVSSWKIPQDFTSSFLFMLQRGHAAQIASWFVLNTCTASVIAALNRCSLAPQTLFWTSGPAAHNKLQKGIRESCEHAFPTSREATTEFLQ